MTWTTKYKKSIDCNNPKGFSQKAHCQGRSARKKGEKTMSKSINEGLVEKFITSFFDSYKRGIEKRFIQKSRERNPELANELQKITNSLENVDKLLKKS